MTDSQPLLLGANPQGEAVHLYPAMANRHGIICGATGTGKTVTLQVLAEQFSALGVPVFTADVKGDLSALATAGAPHEKISERLTTIGITDHTFASSPVTFWDLNQAQGHPVRTTITDMGPMLLSNLLDLSDAQDGILHIAFMVAEDKAWPLVDLKDLKSLLTWLSEHRKTIPTEYGRVTNNSIGAIQRRLLVLEQSGADAFFGEPALDISDLLTTNTDGRGQINLLDAKQLMLSPTLYATFLAWLLTELFKQLPEVGDQPLPKMIFFFDEAHLLFDNAPDVLLEKFEQVVRLIRSKGVGIYFVTQNPSDIPDAVLGQCGNRIQHALRAYTPKDKKAVKVAAESFRPNPALDTVTAITELGVGEALISTLDPDGQPTVVQQTLLRPPLSQFGPSEEATRQQLMATSAFSKKYDMSIDRESAHEILQARRQQEQQAAAQAERAAEAEKMRRSQRSQARRPASRQRRTRRRSRRQSFVEAGFKSFLRSLFSGLGRGLVRSILNAMKGK